MMVDVGSDKEAADSKMRGKCHLTRWMFSSRSNENLIQHFWMTKFDFRRH